MLGQETLVSFLGTADAARARAFYEGALGLTFVLEHEFLMIFQSGAARVALQKLDSVTPLHGTALGWNVSDIEGAIRALMARGVTFERYEGHDQDELGIWRPAPGTGVAWFKDPDGNLLSLSQG
ncbi:MAG TPA: VOC family protein [Caulobacteraceae bacterium]|jgi:catechol 2,3-dioxygenase-like lactoylglutathione lyase family enzyme